MDEDNRVPLIADVENVEAGCCCYNNSRDYVNCSCHKWSNIHKFYAWLLVGMVFLCCGLTSVWYIGIPGADIATGIFFGASLVIIVGCFIWGHYNLPPWRPLYYRIM